MDRKHPPELDDLRLWCRKVLADYKSPDRIVIVDGLPRNQMGKVDKRVLVGSYRA